MPNMSYCRFENTLSDLHNCYDHLFDHLNKSESNNRLKLVRLCQDIVNEFSEDDVDPEDKEDEEDE